MLFSKPYRIVISTLCLFAVIHHVNGQQLRFYKVTTEYSLTKTMKEEYYVLQSNQNVKHGLYKLHNINGHLIEQGDFSDNLKGGIWGEYYSGKRLKASGNYVKGKKIGQWQYFFSDGRMYEKFDLESRHVLFLDDSLKQFIENVDTLDVIPCHPFGYFEMAAILDEFVQYPELAEQLKVEGVAKASFIVTPNGQLSKIKASEESGREKSMGFASEFTKAIKLLGKEKWTPGEIKGRKVPVRITLTYEFKLS